MRPSAASIPQHREVAAGDGLGQGHLHAPARAVGLRRHELRGRDVAEHFGRGVADVLEVGIGERTVGERRLVEIEVDDLLRPLDGRVAEDDGVDEAEDRRVGSDAERERQNGHRRERRPPGERPRAVAHVAAEVGGAEAAHVATQFLDHLHASQARERRAARLLRRHAPADVLLDVQRHVRLQLRIELPFEMLPAEQIHKARR